MYSRRRSCCMCTEMPRVTCSIEDCADRVIGSVFYGLLWGNTERCHKHVCSKSAVCPTHITVATPPKLRLALSALAAVSDMREVYRQCRDSRTTGISSACGARNSLRALRLNAAEGAPWNVSLFPFVCNWGCFENIVALQWSIHESSIAYKIILFNNSCKHAF